MIRVYMLFMNYGFGWEYEAIHRTMPTNGEIAEAFNKRWRTDLTAETVREHMHYRVTIDQV